jgi:tetratricopeptide (TPR) repeat protein
LIALDPNNADTNAFIGLALRRTERYQEAIEWYKQAIRLNPITPIWYYSALCRNYLKDGQYQEALAVGRLMVEKYPDAGGAYLYLVASYYVMGRVGEAIALCQ